MYEKLFDKKSQEDMRNFFLNELAPLGSIRRCCKNEVLDVDSSNYICIVTEGKFKQVLYDASGNEKVMFFLIPGEIFGETCYFVSGDMHVLLKSCCISKISLVERSILDDFISKNPGSYEFFIHSLVRKYRISITQMHDLLFTSSKQKVTNTLYRLSVQSGIEINGCTIIDIKFTHQELANLIGSSRITVTRVLKELKQDNIIDSTSDKKFIIKDVNKLKEIIQI